MSNPDLPKTDEEIALRALRESDPDIVEMHGGLRAIQATTAIAIATLILAATFPEKTSRIIEQLRSMLAGL